MPCFRVRIKKYVILELQHHDQILHVFALISEVDWLLAWTHKVLCKERLGVLICIYLMSGRAFRVGDIRRRNSRKCEPRAKINIWKRWKNRGDERERNENQGSNTRRISGSKGNSVISIYGGQTLRSEWGHHDNITIKSTDNITLCDQYNGQIWITVFKWPENRLLEVQVQLQHFHASSVVVLLHHPLLHPPHPGSQSPVLTLGCHPVHRCRSPPLSPSLPLFCCVVQSGLGAAWRPSCPTSAAAGPEA